LYSAYLEQSMHRRTFLRSLTALAALPAVALLSACGALPHPPGTLKKAPTTLRFVMGPFFNFGAVDAGDQQQLPPIMESFHAAFPDVTVETVQVTDFQVYQRYSKTYLDPSESSHADLVMVRSLGNPIDVTQMVPLEPLLKRDKDIKLDDFYPQALHRMTLQGHIVALPRDIQPNMIVYYNTDLLSEAGVAPPTEGWTLDEFLQMTQQISRTLSKKAEPAMRYAFTDTNSVDGFFAFIQLFGGALMDRNTGNITIDDDAAVAGAQFYADLHSKYRVLPNRLDRTVAYSAASPVTQFILGNVPMFATSPDMISLLRTMKRQLSWDIATLPIKPDVKQNWDAIASSLLIPKASTQQDAAWALAKYLSVGPGMQARAGLGDLHPASKKLAMGPAWLNKQAPNNRPLLNTIGMERMIDTDPNAPSAIQGTPLPGTRPDNNAMYRVVYNSLDDLLMGKITAQHLLKQAKDAANKPLSGR